MCVSGFRWGIGVCLAAWLIGPRTVRVVTETQPAAAQTSSPVDGACHLHKQAVDDVRIYVAPLTAFSSSISSYLNLMTWY